VNGVYITYNRREDATRAIAGVDGSPSPGGGEVMRASYGTTKYCMNFLRNALCTNPTCMELHEWGDERDCFTKQDLSTLYVFASLFYSMLYELIARVTKENMHSKILNTGKSMLLLRKPIVCSFLA
jgi:hypothetical protein